MVLIGLSTALHVNAQTTDVGVSNLLSPAAGLCGGSASDVTVIITNYGTTDVTSMTIDWSVNGSSQPTIIYSDTLLSGSTDTVTLGTYTFPRSSTNNLTVFTANPNGAVDDDPTNDTLNRSISVPMSGIYTVGGASPDYANITAAVGALTSFGVCGPVTFNIRPLIDTVKIIIPVITGSSSTNTITFQAENGDSSSVKFTFRSEVTALNPNYVFLLDGADYITFNNISVERTGLEPYARAIELRNSACFITITGCQLIGAPQIQVANSLAAIVYSSATAPTNDSNFVFTGNLIKNGSLGLYLNGVASLNPTNNVVISGNTFVNQYAKGMDMTCFGAVVISGNTFTTNTGYTQFTGIELDRSQRNQSVTKNKISGSVKVGMNFIDCSGYNGTPGVVANNFIQATDSIGLRVNNGEYQHYYYNSVNMTGANSASFEFSGIGVGNRSVDNIFANNGGGLAIRVLNSASAGLVRSNYNDFYTTGSLLGSWDGAAVATIGAWRTTANHDTNSVNSDPVFVSNTDLHASGTGIDNAGTPLAGITDDIDGVSRNATTPDIGADEFTGVVRDLTVTAILTPANNTCGSDSAVVTAVILNQGGGSASNFNVSMRSSALVGTSTVLYSGNLAPLASDTVTFTTTVNTSAGGNITFTVFTSASIDDNRANDTLTVSRAITPIPGPPTTTSDSICGGGTATLSATSPFTITWYSAASGGTSIGTGPSFTTPSLTATTVYYASQTTNGCESSRAPASAVVLPQPTVNLGNDTSAISGNSIILNAGAGSTSYNWSIGATSQTIVVSTDGCYSVEVSNTYGCTASDTVCVTFVQPTDLALSSIDSPFTGICGSATLPITVTIQNSGPNPATNFTVTASVSGIATASLSGTFTGTLATGASTAFTIGTVNAASAGSLTVIVTITYVADNNTLNNTLSSSFTILPQPALPVANDVSRCGAGSVILNSSSTQGTIWYDAATGGTVVGTGNSFTTPNLSQTTTYYAQNGSVCSGQDRLAVTITINPLPSVYLGPDVNVSSPITLDAGPGFASYNWSNGQSTQTILVVQTGTYFVLVTDAQGCVNSDTILVQFGVGINENSPFTSLQVFPNPSNGRITLEGNAKRSEATLLQLNDPRGATVFSQIINPTSGAFKQDFDWSLLAKGVYTLTLSNSQGASHQRIVIQ